MPSLIDIRRRIRAVKSTQQITKAMKMVAASRMRRAYERIVNTRPFSKQMLRVLHGLASRVDDAIVRAPHSRRRDHLHCLGDLLRRLDGANAPADIDK